MVLIILSPRVLAGNRGPLKLDASGRVYQENREITGVVQYPRIGNIRTAPPLPSLAKSDGAKGECACLPEARSRELMDTSC